jgi:lipoprotein-anchoring transpeptidase ErfK/SrfK
MMVKRLRSLAKLAAVAAMIAVSGCSVQEQRDIFGDARRPPKYPFLPDTGSMNAERFGDETFPVFMRPAETPYAMQPRGDSPVAPNAYPPAPSSSLNSDDHSLSSSNAPPRQSRDVAQLGSDIWTRYAQTDDKGHLLPAIPIDQVEPGLLRQKVAYQTQEKPGTLVVDTRARFLYLVEGGGHALRYGVGLGRQGYAWSGRGVIRYRKQWPHWTPTDGMAKNDPDLKSISGDRGGMVAGIDNPLGARALYIFKDGKDTLYRVHGTPDWRSIGKSTSSGCVRMFNQDVIDLYSRVRDGATIVVI